MLASSQSLKSSAVVNGTLTHIKPFKLRTPFALTPGSLALLLHMRSWQLFFFEDGKCLSALSLCKLLKHLYTHCRMFYFGQVIDQTIFRSLYISNIGLLE